MINVVVIQGRLANEPELKTTTTGKSVTKFSVAVDKRFGKKDEEPNYFDIVAWNSTAEFITRYFRKGSAIAIDGYLEARKYEDKNGNKRKVVEIIAENVSFCGSKQSANAFVSDEPIEEDELPF